MSLYLELRRQLFIAQSMLKNGESMEAYRSAVDALRRAYRVVQPLTQLENGKPWPELIAPHSLMLENFQKNYSAALRNVDHAVLILDDLDLDGPDPALHNEVADSILEALKVL